MQAEISIASENNAIRIGVDPGGITPTTYINGTGTAPLDVQMNGLTQFRLNPLGLLPDPTTSKFLALTTVGDVLVTATPTAGPDVPETLTNKTIYVTQNSVIMDNIAGSPNIVDTVTQQMRTTDNVNFGSVSTLGAVVATGNVQGANGRFNTINSIALDNTATINGVNPLTTNNNLTAHVASTAAHGTTSDIVGINDTQRLTNKNIAVPSCKLVDNSDSTKIITFNDAAAVTGTTLTLTAAQTASRNLALPDATDTLVARNTVDTLTNKTLNSGVNTLTLTNLFLTNVNINNLIGQAVRPSDTPTFASITVPTITNVGILTLPTTTDTLVGKATTDTLTNKTLVDATTSIKKSSGNAFTTFDLSGMTDGTTLILAATNTNSRVINFPDATTTLVGTGVVQTLTNKTLTAPVISTISNGGTLTLPIGPQTLVGRTTTDTLTNKTIDSASNTLTITNAPLAAANINTLINQDVRTSATPTFTSGVNLTQTGNTSFSILTKADYAYSNAAGAYFTTAAAGDINLRNQDTTKSLNIGIGSGIPQLAIGNTAISYTQPISGFSGAIKTTSTFPASLSQAAGATTTLLTIPIPTNSSVAVYVYLSVRKLTGTITGYSSFLTDVKAINNAGTVTQTAGNNSSVAQTAIAGAYNGKTTLAFVVSTTNLLVNVANTFVDGTNVYGGEIYVAWS